jgi:hypothetical protein
MVAKRFGAYLDPDFWHCAAGEVFRWQFGNDGTTGSTECH